jgi:F-type H+-transporting ATPase subunit delta
VAKKLSRRTLAKYIVDQIQSGASKATIVKQVASYLIETRRTKELPLIVKDVEQELMERGIANATITSAFELSDATLSSIKSMIRHQTGAASVELSEHVDASVLGGIKLELPGRELDNTIARKLTGLRTNYKKA